MDEKPIENKEREDPVVEKKVYSPPTVTVYGKLTELTAGTGTVTEHGDKGSAHKTVGRCISYIIIQIHLS
jgi:hypothetical protein